MLALLLTALGLGFLILGWGVLRSYGDALRIGRLLSAAPDVSIGEAVEMARRGELRYVRVHGRVDAEAPFPDEHGRPLVLRRERVEARDGQRWRAIHAARRHVPFGLRDRLAEIAVDAETLDAGLIVIPRESEGRAGDIAERFEGPVDPGRVVRFRIDQVSAVEHAYAAGVPRLGPDGLTRLAPGGDRPLILTTVEVPEAMRLLAHGGRARATLAAGLLIVGLACLAAALVALVAALAFPAAVLAESPVPTALPGGDTRSSGEGAGLVGQPFTVAIGVLLLGIVSAGLALLYVRVVERRP